MDTPALTVKLEEALRQIAKLEAQLQGATALLNNARMRFGELEAENNRAIARAAIAEARNERFREKIKRLSRRLEDGSAMLELECAARERAEQKLREARP